MAKAKDVSGTGKKKATSRTRKAATAKAAARPASARRAQPTRGEEKKSRPRARKKTEAEPAPPQASVEPSMSEAQSQVVASKFAGAEIPPARPLVRPTLPASYGESHLLLLVRDPQTLFAAWDIAPSTLDALKGRLGRRGFAVSTLTLRLTRAGGGTTVLHVGNKARSRYLKINGGPSFIAEIGFTTPAGRFELVARSVPCFVPMGPLARPASGESPRRAVLGYREARALIRSGGGKRGSAAAARARANAALEFDAERVLTVPRNLGGASDLYRR